MQLSLADRTVLVTGGGSGIGKGVAAAVVAAGGKAMLVGLSPMAAIGQRKDPATGQWEWRRDNGSTADWPSRWPSRAEHLPEPPDRWVPERAGSAVIICVRGSRYGNPSQVISWGSAEDAELADRLLYGQPCGTGCVGNHLRCGPNRDASGSPRAFTTCHRRAWPRSWRRATRASSTATRFERALRRSRPLRQPGRARPS